MRIDMVSPEVAADIERRIAKGYGELVRVRWTDLAQGEDGTLVPVPQEADFYVGKMTLGQTGTVVATLAALFVNGADLKEATGRGDNIAFINAMDEHNAAVLIGTILGASSEWVLENFDIEWAVDVITAFFKHNDFLKVAKQVINLLGKYGLGEDQLRKVALGQNAD